MIRKILRRIKKILTINWIKSTYINFNVLPLDQAIKYPFIVTGKVKIRSLKGRVKLNCKANFGLVNIGCDVDNMPISLLPAQLMIKGILVLNGNIILNQGANLVVWPNAIMDLGNDVMICGGVTLKAVNKVSVGNHVMISSGCFIMDSSIHCLYDTESLKVASPTGEIQIGDNVWLNMNTDIVKNGVIPSGCITARYTFINKPIDKKHINCMLAGQPAKIIKQNTTQLHNFTLEKIVSLYYKNSTDGDIFELSKDENKCENLCKKITG